MTTKKIPWLVLSALLLSPTSVLAADYGAWFSGIINNAINLIVWPVFAGVAIIGTVWIGIKFLTSGGDTKKFGDASRGLFFVIIGIIIALLANAIVVTITAVIVG